jgi:hypothetical protein
MNVIKAILLIIILVLTVSPDAEGCTTAIINGEASRDGAPMLWKNRDTGFLSNKVIYVDESPFDYVALINARETSGCWVYAGVNSEGLGIMNSVAYNLPEDNDGMKDLEGRIMADALRTCRSAGDFEVYIKKNLGSALGSWANYGVIDADGNAVIFELYNHGYKRYDTADAPKKYLVNSNFARSGEEGKGAGYLRFERASLLFDAIPAQKISHPIIFQDIARDFGHMLVKTPAIKELENISAGTPVWIRGGDTINRGYTASVAVINGKIPGNKKSAATFWVILGEPVTSIAVPVWVEAGQTPAALYDGEAAPLCKEASRLKDIIRPYSQSDKKHYMQLTRLVNKEKTGFLPLILKAEQEIFEETEKFLKKAHTASEFAAFQEQMAEKALETLKKIGN